MHYSFPYNKLKLCKVETVSSLQVASIYGEQAYNADYCIRVDPFFDSLILLEGQNQNTTHHFHSRMYAGFILQQFWESFENQVHRR